jgi:hypothetical protein
MICGYAYRRSAQFDDEDEPFVFIHYTLSGTGQDWYVMAGEPQKDDFVFWGFVRHESRFACFRLTELEATAGPSVKPWP